MCPVSHRPGWRDLALKIRTQRQHVSVRGSITVNETETAIHVALDGLGIVYTLDDLVEPFVRNGQLVRVLANWSLC
jgi:DNA-binding transcriptional LysR family regulator